MKVTIKREGYKQCGERWATNGWRWLRRILSPKPRYGDPPDLLLRGFACFQALVAGCQFDLFTMLSANPDSTADDITSRLKIPNRSVRILLLVCASLGLLKLNKRKGTYRNTWKVEKLFVRNKPGNALEILEAFHAIMYQPFFHLTDSLREGTNVGLSCFPGPGNSLYARLSRYPELERIFHGWMDSLNTIGVPRPVLTVLRDTEHLVDAGGGDGSNAIRLVQKLQGIRVTIFDLPSVCELAYDRVKQAGMSERISVMPGNFREDPFPDKIDGSCLRTYSISILMRRTKSWCKSVPTAFQKEENLSSLTS